MFSGLSCRGRDGAGLGESGCMPGLKEPFLASSVSTQDICRHCERKE